MPKVPAYAPFVAAGFFFGSAQLLYDVPFDPLLPWIFMGEEVRVRQCACQCVRLI